MSASVTTWAAVPLAQAGLVSAAVVRTDANAPALLPEPPPVRAPGPPSTTAALLTGRAAGEELDVAERAVADGRPELAVERLAVLLRLDPALAPVILGVADRAAEGLAPGAPGLSALHLVRGDALRHLGRENEAVAAYQMAHQALAGGPVLKEVS